MSLESSIIIVDAKGLATPYFEDYLYRISKEGGAVADAVPSAVSVDSSNATDLASVITLANETKTDVNALVTDLNNAITQVNALLDSLRAAGKLDE
jgi:hypothetical protein